MTIHPKLHVLLTQVNAKQGLIKYEKKETKQYWNNFDNYMVHKHYCT